MMNYKLNVFLVLIFLSTACYFTLIQFFRYAADEDVSVVTFKELRLDSFSEDQYPSYTVCFYGWQGKIYMEDAESWNISFATPKVYYQYLSGISQFTKEIGNNSMDQANLIFSEIDFEDVIGELFYRVVKSFHIYGSTKIYGCTAFTNDGQRNLECKIPWFQKTYQTEQTVCYTRMFDQTTESSIRFERLMLHVPELIKMYVSVNIYVHQKGNLLEHMANNWIIKNLVDSRTRQYYSFKASQFARQLRQKRNDKQNSNQSFDQIVVYRISDIIVLRHRNKRDAKCNQIEMNVDESWRATIIKSFDCVPTYWNTFLVNSSTTSKLRPCTYNEYRNVTKYINGLKTFPSHYEVVSQNIIKSCKEVKRKVSVETKDIIWKTTTESSYLNLIFKYDEDYYMLVTNTKGFDGESLLSQVGGFIGNILP